MKAAIIDDSRTIRLILGRIVRQEVAGRVRAQRLTDFDQEDLTGNRRHDFIPVLSMAVAT